MAAPSKGKDAKRRIVTMRVTNAGYERIHKAAEANGRSVTQEIESRLEMSFQEERIMGGSNAALLTKLIASSIGLIELETGRSWTEDRMTWAAANAAVRRIMGWFQPTIDADIWMRHRESALWGFMQAVFDLDEARRKIEGLKSAYSTHMPLDVSKRYNVELERYPKLLEEVRLRAKAVFDGPLKEQAERDREAIKLGRQIAGERQGQRGVNFLVAGVARMFKESGAVEPLPGLRDPSTVTDEELMECIRLLAGAQPDDPDMAVFKIPRSFEELEKSNDGDDQEA